MIFMARNLHVLNLDSPSLARCICRADRRCASSSRCCCSCCCSSCWLKRSVSCVRTARRCRSSGVDKGYGEMVGGCDIGTAYNGIKYKYIYIFIYLLIFCNLYIVYYVLHRLYIYIYIYICINIISVNYIHHILHIT